MLAFNELLLCNVDSEPYSSFYQMLITAYITNVNNNAIYLSVLPFTLILYSHSNICNNDCNV